MKIEDLQIINNYPKNMKTHCGKEYIKKGWYDKHVEECEFCSKPWWKRILIRIFK